MVINLTCNKHIYFTFVDIKALYIKKRNEQPSKSNPTSNNILYIYIFLNEFFVIFAIQPKKNTPTT